MKMTYDRYLSDPDEVKEKVVVLLRLIDNDIYILPKKICVKI